MGRERDYQADLIKEIYRRFPGCLVLKNDERYIQGIPDLTILFGARWAVLEVKRSANEPFRPNQEWYLEQLNEMGFASVIYPTIESEVLHAVQRAFES